MQKHPAKVIIKLFCIFLNFFSSSKVELAACCTLMLTFLFTLTLFVIFKEGAQTSIHVAVSEDCRKVTGQYFSDCKVAKISNEAQVCLHLQIL